MTSTVHVEVLGLTGSGKSAVMGEIEIALNALGLNVEHGPDFQAEKNATHADWQEALDLYQPTVVLTERNISRAPEVREGDRPAAWRTTCESLIDIVEGIGGIQHGTWRDEKGTRLKDTSAWAAFYVAARTAAPSADKLRETFEALVPALDAVDEPAPKPLPEQSSRVAEAMAGKTDDTARRQWEGRVYAAKNDLVFKVRQALAALKAEGK